MGNYTSSNSNFRHYTREDAYEEVKDQCKFIFNTNELISSIALTGSSLGENENSIIEYECRGIDNLGNIFNFMYHCDGSYNQCSLDGFVIFKQNK